MKTPVINNTNYIVYFEHYRDINVIHCDCYKWSRSIKEQLSKDFDLLMSVYREPVYAIHEIEDTKHLKFLLMMGFEYSNDFVGTDSKLRQLFVRKY